jgi:Rps23 Pro-64 3,4-dihydroxylase Tpa1-like proline 4-hydroxylase
MLCVILSLDSPQIAVSGAELVGTRFEAFDLGQEEVAVSTILESPAAHTYKQIPGFYFDRDELARNAAALHEQFVHAEPFPHIVMPNFLPLDIARAITAEFPKPDDIEWRLAGPGDSRHTGNKYVEKLGMSNESNFPPLIRHVMNQFYSGSFMSFVEAVTGYQNIVADPSFYGCGMHSTGRGGRLMVHADASRHPNPKLEQIINLIYYVTPDWQDAYNGHLELWDKEAKACIKKIKPEYNSAVMFYTGSKSFHGHPIPLACPVDIRRNSLACYYYTTDRTLDETYEGYRNYVDWKRTNELDQNISLGHRAKELLRRHAPRQLTNALTTIVRRLRR